MSFVSPRKKKHSRDGPSFPKSKPRTPGRWTLQVLRNFVDRKLKKNFSPRKQKSSLVSLLCCYSPSLRSLVGKWRQQSRSVPGGASRGCHQWSWEFPHLPAKHTTECSRLFKTHSGKEQFSHGFFSDRFSVTMLLLGQLISFSNILQHTYFFFVLRIFWVPSCSRVFAEMMWAP